MTVDKSSAFGNLVPISIFAGYLLICSTLGLLIGRSLWGRVPAFRDRLPAAANHLYIFGSLVVLSLAVTWYYMIAFFSFSYHAWLARQESSPGLQLGKWLHDTELFKDAWEVAIESPASFWWSQQIFLVFASWSVFVGVEGHRRRIPHLWAYILLAQLVAVSVAQNLFFLAIILLPQTPLKEHDAPRSSISTSNLLHWSQQMIIYIIPLSISFVSIFLIPSTANTAWFLPTLLLPHIFLAIPALFPTLLLPAARSAPNGHQRVFALLSVTSLFFHIRATLLVMSNMDLHPYHSRHANPVGGPISALKDLIMHFNAELYQSFLSHPAVTSVSCDVLLCGLSALVWAALNVRKGRSLIAHSLGISFALSSSITSNSGDKNDVGNTTEQSLLTGDTSLRHRAGSGIKARRLVSLDMNDDENAPNEEVIDMETKHARWILRWIEIPLVLPFQYLCGTGVLASGVFGTEIQSKSH